MWISESLIWARTNLIKAMFMVFFGLMVYAGYRGIDLFFPTWAAAYHSQHSDLKRAIFSYAKLDEILSRLRTEYKASRVALFRFHDSQKDASRMAFYFLSVANIVGVSRIDQQGLKDIPASTFVVVLPTMVKNEIWFSWIQTLPSSPLKELFNNRGARAILFAPMVDLDKNLIGMLCFEWLSETDVPVVTNQMKAELSANATLISGYFSLAQLKDVP